MIMHDQKKPVAAIIASMGDQKPPEELDERKEAKKAIVEEMFQAFKSNSPEQFAEALGAFIEEHETQPPSEVE